jgi:hypothetical protein
MSMASCKYGDAQISERHDRKAGLRAEGCEVHT